MPKKFHEKIAPFIGITFDVKSVTVDETVTEETVNIVLVRKRMSQTDGLVD